MENNIKDALRVIFNLAMEVNEQGKHHVFLELSPHVEWITIHTYKDGWVVGSNPTVRIDCNYATTDSTEKLIEMKNLLIEYLEV